MKTQDYSQPTFYHFSQTTIQAALWVSHYLQIHQKRIENLIDLFAGSGIFSIELMNRMPNASIQHWHLIEEQYEFESSLKLNCERFMNKNPAIIAQIIFNDSLKWLNSNMQNLSTMDLILLNPPYYFKEEGESSHDPHRAKCCAIEKKYWLNFIQLMDKSESQFIMMLKQHTQLYLETRKILKHKIKLLQPLDGNEFLILVN